MKNSDKLGLSGFDFEKVDFSKGAGLVPTIIQDANGVVLSLVYSNKESLQNSIKTRKVWRFSRQTKSVVMKGATSGNEQEITSIFADCDNDSLLFKVIQKSAKSFLGDACHFGRYSCFGLEAKFSFGDLYNKIEARKENAPSRSYTRKLFMDGELLKRKLIEEAAEVITAKSKKEIVWECADLIYFLFVIMSSKGVKLIDIEKENARRDYERK
jgi:phosphoribosyl-ATP pyrophosphohydrolase